MSYITRVLSTMSRFGMRSLNRLFSHFFWFNLSAFRLASPPGGMRLPPEVEPCNTYIRDLVSVRGRFGIIRPLLLRLSRSVGPALSRCW